MLKKKTSVRRNLHTLVGGDWIAAENSARNSCINLVPEFPMAAPYRGNFQVVQSNAGRVKVVNSAFYDDDDETAAQSSGELQLRWMKIVQVPGEETRYIAQPQEKTVTVPDMYDCQVTGNGWLYLKMSRLSAPIGEADFHDKVLGDVYLRYHLFFDEKLPDDTKNSSILPLAAITVDQQGYIDEIIQQQYGPGVLWVPVDVGSDSSSAIITPDPPPEEPEEPDTPVIPDTPKPPVILPGDSSSSSVSDEIIISVTLEYNETSIADFIGNGVETHTTKVLLNGQFTADANYPANGYIVNLTGTATYDYGGGDVESETLSWDVTLYRNINSARWDVYHLRINDWAGFYQEKDSEFDTDFSTPVYIFPDLQSMPNYPSGYIAVDHKLILGASKNIPDMDQTSSLLIKFVRI